MKNIFTRITCLAIAITAFTYVNPIKAQTIFTFAGTGISGSTGDGGAATAAKLDAPMGTAVDASGNVYIADFTNQTVRKVNPSGIISIFAGTNGVASSLGDGGNATAATLNYPHGVAVDGSGNVYISEYAGNRIRKVDPSGIITTFAVGGITAPSGICVDGAGNLYIANQGNFKVTKVTPAGVKTTYAGTGSSGYSGDGGPATAADLAGVTGVAMDIFGNLYIATFDDPHIRVVDFAGNINTFAGTGAVGFGGDGGPAISATFSQPYGCAVDGAGNVYVADPTDRRIRKIDIASGNISTIAGTGVTGYNGDNIAATTANLDPNHVCVAPSGDLFITDYYRVRVVSNCIGAPDVSPISGSGTVCESATIILTDTAHGGAWSSSNPGIATVAPGGIVTGVSAGVDTIMFTKSNACGSTSVSFTVTVDPLPVVAGITGPDNVCVASTITVADLTPGGSWGVVTGRASVTPAGVVLGIAGGLDTITYTLFNACGSSVATWPVTVNPLASAGVISGLSSVCIGSTITLVDPVPGGTWAVITGNSSVAGGIVTGLTPGPDTITYTVTNVCGSDMVSMPVTVTLTPDAGIITGSSVVCTGFSTTLSNATPGGVFSASNGNATITAGGVLVGVTVGLDTISYTVTLPCGTGVSTFVVSIQSTPSAGVVSGPSAVCVGTNITLTSTVPGGFWNASNANATVVGGVVTGMATGIDTIIYTIFNACGAASVNYPVTILDFPNAGVITGPTSVCVGSSITLTDLAPGGLWSASNPSATVLGGLTGGITAGIDTIRYSVSNLCGIATAEYPITVVALPVSGTIIGPSVVCELASVSLADLSPGGVWSTRGVHGSMTGGILNGVTAGLDTVVYTVTNICGTAVSTYPVSVNPLPHAGVITGPATVCRGANITLGDTALAGTWSEFNGRATVLGPVVTGVTVGTDTVYYSVTNSCGTAVAKKLITVTDVPVVAPITGVNHTVCVGATITLADATPGGTWGVSNGSATVTGGIVTGMAVGNVDINYTVTNTCGSTSVTQTVNVITIPAPGAIGGRDSVCIDQMTTLFNTVGGGTWTTSNNNALIDATGVVVGNFVGLDTITYTVTNQCGTGSATVVVTIVPDVICYHVGVNPVAGIETELKVFPNPSEGFFTLNLVSDVNEEVNVTVANMVGETVHTFRTTTNKAADVKLSIPSGMYFITASTANGKYTSRIVIQ